MQSSPNASVVLDSATSSQVELPYRTPTIETPLIVEPEEEPEVIVKVNKNGFTTWVSGEGEGGEPPNLDIILVQGLESNEYYTWVGRRPGTKRRPALKHQKSSTYMRVASRLFNMGESPADEQPDDGAAAGETEFKVDESDVFWPKDLLPRNGLLSRARIATYAYPSSFFVRKTKTHLDYCGEELLNALRIWRQTGQARRRPLILVGHSLGALVIQQALSLADHGSDYADIKDSTAGILFLGGPMQGSEAASMASKIERVFFIESSILKTLEPGSHDLARLNRNFMAGYAKLKPVCFYETIDQVYPGRNIMIVNPESATIIGAPRAALSTDHSGLNKFYGEDDDNYQKFLAHLLERAKYAIDEHSKKSSSGMGINMIAFPKHTGYVERGDILKRVGAVFETFPDNPIAALVGLGGVGKSQLAIEYAYRLREEHPDTSVFWVFASDAGRFETSYQQIRAEVRMPGFDNPGQSTLDLVHQWLCSKASGKWLMILDNADDPDFVSRRHDSGLSGFWSHGKKKGAEEPGFTISQYLPRRADGHILLTSRVRHAASNLVENPEHIVPVGPMTEDEALALLSEKLKPSGDGDDFGLRERLVRSLDFYPLAISQAAAYISGRQRMTLSKYLDLILSCSPATPLLEETGDVRRDDSIPNSIYKTWFMSFQQLHHENPAAYELLGVLSVYNNSDIPEFLIGEHGKELDDCVETLLQYGFLAMDPDSARYGMQRLVRSATHLQLKRTPAASGTALDAAVDAALHRLADCYPTDGARSRATCRLLEPHVASVLSHDPATPSATVQRAIVQTNRALYLATVATLGVSDRIPWSSAAEQADADQPASPGVAKAAEEVRQAAHEARKAMHRATEAAEAMAVSAHADLERALGKADPLAIHALTNLGRVHALRERWGHATKALTRALALVDKALGRTHPAALAAAHHLADAHMARRDFRDALRLNARVYDAHAAALGPAHEDTLAAATQLAEAHRRTGDPAKAEELLSQTLTLKTEALGPSHPDLLGTMHALALAHKARGRLPAAEVMQRRALKLATELLGPEHPHALTSLHNLAGILRRSPARLAEAEELAERNAEACQRILGPGHRRTREAAERLAGVYTTQGKYAEARRMLYGVLLSGEGGSWGGLSPKAAGGILVARAGMTVESATKLGESAVKLGESAAKFGVGLGIWRGSGDRKGGKDGKGGGVEVGEDKTEMVESPTDLERKGEAQGILDGEDKVGCSSPEKI